MSVKPYYDRCPSCGQAEVGQQGEYPCSVCGRPQTWGTWDQNLVEQSECLSTEEKLSLRDCSKEVWPERVKK